MSVGQFSVPLLESLYYTINPILFSRFPPEVEDFRLQTSSSS